MKSGHIDLSSFNNWHRAVSYELHSNPMSGFNFIDPLDKQRYLESSINVYLHRDLDLSVISYLEEQFDWVENKSYSIQKLKPGMLLPWHVDAYGFFKKTNGVDDTTQIIRIIIFLEDWNRGHVSEIDQTPVTSWKAGDWVSWTGQTPHMAANLGHTDRYTLQITGIVNG